MPAKKTVNAPVAAKPFLAETFAEVVEAKNALESFASRLNPEIGKNKEGAVGTLDYIAADFSPFCGGKGGITVSKLIHLSKLCFYNNQSYRNAILNQVFLSNTELLIRGYDEEKVKFFRTWFEKVNMWNIRNYFFTEWFRSGNVFIWRFNGNYSLGEMRENMKEIKETTAKNRTIPIGYTIIDPESVSSLGAAAFVNQQYGKLLNAYEVERLKNPSTPQEREFLKSLSPQDRKNIQNGVNPMITLAPENLIAIFNNKQPYEPLAVPTYSPILKSINLKNCMRQADLMLMETIDMVVLFVTAGTEGGDSSPMNQQIIKSLTALLHNRGAGKAIVTHYSAKAAFIVPDLTKIMSADRYEALDREIAAGLMDLFSMDSSYASGYTKTKIYLELLQQSRDAFLTQFLIPEMKRIAKELGWDTIPTVQFEEISLESDIEKFKIYSRLYEMGQLTAEGLEMAFRDRELPPNSINQEQQKNFKKQKDAGLFQPIAANMGTEEGRPAGTKKTQTKKTVRPAGASEGDYASLEVIQSNLTKMNEVFAAAAEEYKNAHNLKRLSKKQGALAEAVATNILTNEPPEKWMEVVKDYVKTPLAIVATDQRMEILEIQEDMELTALSAAMLYHGRSSQIQSEDVKD